MKQNQLVERPTLLTWGIILMAAKSAFFFLLLFLSLFGVPILFGIGAADAPGDDWIAVVLVGFLFELFVFVLAGFQLLSLYACKKSWDLSRTWLFVLMVLAAMSVFDATIVGLPIAALVIVGGVQALERTKEAHDAKLSSEPTTATAV